LIIDSNIHLDKLNLRKNNRNINSSKTKIQSNSDVKTDKPPHVVAHTNGNTDPIPLISHSENITKEKITYFAKTAINFYHNLSNLEKIENSQRLFGINEVV